LISLWLYGIDLRSPSIPSILPEAFYFFHECLSLFLISIVGKKETTRQTVIAAVREVIAAAMRKNKKSNMFKKSVKEVELNS